MANLCFMRRSIISLMMAPIYALNGGIYLMKKEITVKNTGFSYIETIYSLFLFINLFVLCGQIFYNINSENRFYEEGRIISYETVVLRMEKDIKEAHEIEIGEDYIKYHRNNQIYYYTVFNHYLSLQIDLSRKYLLNNLNSISFQINGHFLSITFVDIYNKTYTTRIIVYD